MGTKPPHGNQVMNLTAVQYESICALIACRGKESAIKQVSHFLDGEDLDAAKAFIDKADVDEDTRHIK